jgi:hypothetical protein
MKELAEVKSSVLQLHKGAEKRLEAFIQVQPSVSPSTVTFTPIAFCFDKILTHDIGRAQRMGSDARQPKP